MSVSILLKESFEPNRKPVGTGFELSVSYVLFNMCALIGSTIRFNVTLIKIVAFHIAYYGYKMHLPCFELTLLMQTWSNEEPSVRVFKNQKYA